MQGPPHQEVPPVTHAVPCVEDIWEAPAAGGRHAVTSSHAPEQCGSRGTNKEPPLCPQPQTLWQGRSAEDWHLHWEPSCSLELKHGPKKRFG